ncbi:MAG: TRAP transporter small permease [Selenomonadaceae bacterium]|nr:TRAP transporter small permease [Selenomonadaceae bacterium]
MLDTIRNTIDKVLSAVCCFIFAAMVVIGTYQIITRYVFNSPSTISEELLTYAFTWMSLLISAYVFGKRDHMRVAFLADKLTGTPKKLLDAGIECLTVIVSAIVFFYGGMTIMALTMSQKTASLGISMGTVYTVVPITGALICIYGVLNIIDIMNGVDRRKMREAKE